MSEISDTNARYMAEAREASLDTEDKLLRMRKIKKELIPALESEYTGLRDELVDVLDGPRLFHSEAEGKLIGIVVRPDQTVIHDEYLDELPEEIVEEIAPRKIDRRRLENAIARGHLTDEQIAHLISVKEGAGTPHIRFIETGEKG